MREVDPVPLREAVAEAKLGSARDTLLLHEAERWRDALLGDDEALTRGCMNIRTATHNACAAWCARRGATPTLPPERHNPRSARELFQFIRPLLAETTP